MKIYTKKGDMGETDLFGGSRVSKADMQVKTYGKIDTANAAIGCAYSASGQSENLKEILLQIMKLLFSAGAEVACAPRDKARSLLERDLKNRINEQHIEWLEQCIDKAETHLSPLKSFILPCGSDASARLHFARTIVREAEIALIEFRDNTTALREEIIKFFNRLSDLLFVLARLANYEHNAPDILWNGALES